MSASQAPFCSSSSSTLLPLSLALMHKRWRRWWWRRRRRKRRARVCRKQHGCETLRGHTHVLSKGAWRAITHPCGLLMVASGISIIEQSSTLKKFADKVALNRWDFNGCCSELYLPTVCACACGDDHYISLHLLLSPLGITLHVTRENPSNVAIGIIIIPITWVTHHPI